MQPAGTIILRYQQEPVSFSFPAIGSWTTGQESDEKQPRLIRCCWSQTYRNPAGSTVEKCCVWFILARLKYPWRLLIVFKLLPLLFQTGYMI